MSPRGAGVVTEQAPDWRFRLRRGGGYTGTGTGTGGAGTGTGTGTPVPVRTYGGDGFGRHRFGRHVAMYVEIWSHVCTWDIWWICPHPDHELSGEGQKTLM